MYFLEKKETRPAKMPYSYERRALGTLFLDQWIQRYACEEKGPLVEMLNQLKPGKYRIVSNDGTEPQEYTI